MTDAGGRVERPERVQDPLVCDFSRQANVARRDRTGLRAHQRAAPMRGGPRHVRGPVPAEPREIISNRLDGAGEHEGSAAEEGPEEDLKPSVPSDVVEGGPHDVS